MRVLVCGGRKYSDRETLYSFMDNLHAQDEITTVIEGDQFGADTLAGEWAVERGIQLEVYPAEWKLYGVAAGPIRNKKMLRVGKPDMVVAFPGNKGTANMKKLALDNGVPVVSPAADWSADET